MPSPCGYGDVGFSWQLLFASRDATAKWNCRKRLRETLMCVAMAAMMIGEQSYAVARRSEHEDVLQHNEGGVSMQQIVLKILMCCAITPFLGFK